MIYIDKINNLRDESKEKWAIVCSPKELPSFYKHIPKLGPSPTLFRKYRVKSQNGCFDKAYFENVYVPQFLKEIDEDARELLDSLVKLSREKDIVLCCYCEDETLCHSSILAGILLGLGAKIQTDAQYIKYYEMFRQNKNLKSNL